MILYFLNYLSREPKKFAKFWNMKKNKKKKLIKNFKINLMEKKQKWKT